MTYNRLTDEALLNLLFTEEDRLPRAAADGFVARGPRMISSNNWNMAKPTPLGKAARLTISRGCG